MSILITNIKKLVQVEAKPVRFKAGKQMSELNCIENAFLFIKNGKIADFGKMTKP